MENLFALVGGASRKASSLPEVVAVVTGRRYRLPQASTVQSVRALAQAIIQGLPHSGSLERRGDPETVFRVENPSETRFRGQQRVGRGTPSSVKNEFGQETPSLVQERSVKVKNEFGQGTLSLVQKRDAPVAKAIRQTNPMAVASSLKDFSDTEYARLVKVHLAGEVDVREQLFAIQNLYLVLDSLAHPQCLLHENYQEVCSTYPSYITMLKKYGFSQVKFVEIYNQRRGTCKAIMKGQTRAAIDAYIKFTLNWDSTNTPMDRNVSSCAQAFQAHATQFIETVNVKQGYVSSSVRPRLFTPILGLEEKISTVFKSHPKERDIFAFRGMLEHYLYFYNCDQDAILFDNQQFRAIFLQLILKRAERWLGIFYNTKWWLNYAVFEEERLKLSKELHCPQDWVHAAMLLWARNSDYKVVFNGEKLCRPSLQREGLSVDAVAMKAADIKTYTLLLKKD